MTELDLSSPEALEASLKKAPPKVSKPASKMATKEDLLRLPPKQDDQPTVAWLNERNGEISRRRICYSCPDVCNHGWVELVKR